MEELFCEMIEKIAYDVLENDYDEYHEMYVKRLQFLYTLILEEVKESASNDELEILLEEITDYEKSQKYMVITSLDRYETISAEVALKIYSSTGFGLAIESVKGKDYQMLAGFLRETFYALIEDTDIIGEKLRSTYRILISETLLDFNYASGEFEITSLRLKKQIDFME